MKRCFCILFVFGFIYQIPFAQNLVPNPNFEIYSSCPLGGGQIHNAVPWFVNYSCSGCGSSDYYNACAPAGGSSVPYNITGSFQYARSGVGYAGIIFADILNTNYREYIEVKLDSTLKNGRRYCGSMYLSLVNNSKFLIDKAGIYFSNDSVALPQTSTVYLLPFTPQIENPAGNYLSDTLNWMPVSGIYIAQGGENFITIGNFRDDASTIKLQGYGGNYVYFYIDDVSVVELPEASELTGMDTVICRGDSVQLGIGQKKNVTYTWIGQGMNSYEAQVWVKPSVTTTYTLIASDTSAVCANSSTGYVTVIVKQVATVNAGNDTAICEGSSIIIGESTKPNYAYTWSPTASLNNASLSQPTATPKQTTTYYVAASDTSYGFTCNTITDSVKITVINCDTLKPNSFWVPTAFSPNGDNNNDVLYVYGKNIKELEFSVYNRWGGKIYDGRFTNYDLMNEGFETWNGKYNNENTEQGVYAWYAKIKYKNGEEKNQKGNITILR